ncbi:LADA_0G12310g1_1 [Lachancea dasiensis]|uniref:LADA_0G12310g1_1 n=1 Tax=Lachancea dasiensis TaxID=1072105 RepID=A0A1G4JV89_9SACH|nr:LADA_0G12310g1_1 [Lachancea dasiensis]
MGTVNVTKESEESMLARHSAERKDLQNKITGMKKQATKSKRKQVNARCEELEHQLLEKQRLELASQKQTDYNESKDVDVTPESLLESLQLGSTPAVETESEAPRNTPVEPPVQPKKRRNRQKERIARREAELAQVRKDAALEAANQPDLKQMEQDALEEVCRVNNLRQHDIQPDGHCLFASILDQMRARHQSNASYCIPSGYHKSLDPQDFDVYALRSLSSSYIREHAENFVPYLFDEATLTIKDIDEYTKTMEESAQWGGEVEILALAKVLNCCISVMMSGRATHRVNADEKTNPEIKLVYYKHSYALGEHYNSLRDM